MVRAGVCAWVALCALAARGDGRDADEGALARAEAAGGRTARGGASRDLLKERPEGRLLVPSCGRGILVHGERFAHGHTVNTRGAARRGRELKRDLATRTFLHTFSKTSPLPRGQTYVPTHLTNMPTHLTLMSNSCRTRAKFMLN